MAKPKYRVWVFDNIYKYCTYSGAIWMPLGFFSGSSGKTEQEWEIGEWVSAIRKFTEGHLAHKMYPSILTN